jgi:hypothetical protein
VADLVDDVRLRDDTGHGTVSTADNRQIIAVPQHSGRLDKGSVLCNRHEVLARGPHDCPDKHHTSILHISDLGSETEQRSRIDPEARLTGKKYALLVRDQRASSCDRHDAG